MPAGGAATGSILDSLWVRLGFITDDAGLAEFERKAEAATSSLLKIGGLVGAAAGAIVTRAIAGIDSAFEQNRIQIAGFLNALGMDGTFAAGLKDADDVIQSITVAAAKLPGEAEEYIEVFKSGLPFVQAALPGAGLDQITDFTNKLTAIGKAMKLPADLIGREISEILAPGKGNAQKRLPLFRMFLPLMQKLQGQAHLTSESFNAMTAPQRAGLLMQTFERLQPMLDASSDSFDAMEGALVSTVKLMVRLGTVGLFAGMKEALKTINELFVDEKGNVTDLGKRIARVSEEVGQAIIRWVRVGTDLARMFMSSSLAMNGLKIAAIGLGVAMAGLALEKAVETVGALLYSFTNLKRLLMGGLFAAIGLIAEDLWVFYQGGDSLTGMLEKRFKGAVDLVTVALGLLIAALFRTQIMAMVTATRMALAWVIAAGPIATLVLAIIGIGTALYEVIDHWDEFSREAQGAIGFVATVVAGLTAAFIALKGEAIMAAVDAAAAWLAAALPVVALGVALAAVAALSYEAGQAMSDSASTAAQRWHELLDFLKETYNMLVKITSLGFAKGPFDTDADKTEREFQDFQKEQAFNKANGKTNKVNFSPATGSVDASWMPGTFKNPRARQEDFTPMSSNALTMPSSDQMQDPAFRARWEKMRADLEAKGGSVSNQPAESGAATEPAPAASGGAVQAFKDIAARAGGLQGILDSAGKAVDAMKGTAPDGAGSRTGSSSVPMPPEMGGPRVVDKSIHVTMQGGITNHITTDKPDAVAGTTADAFSSAVQSATRDLQSKQDQ